MIQERAYHPMHHQIPRRRWKNDIVSGNATILIGLAAALVVTAVTLAEMSGANWHIVFYALAAFAVPLGVSIFRINRFGICDPGAIFLIFFTGYNGFLLCRVAVGILGEDLKMPYPIHYSSEVYTECAFLSFVFSVVLGASLFLLSFRPVRTRMHVDDLNVLAGAAFPVGIIFFMIGNLFMILNILKLGGMREVFSMQKLTRFELTREAGLLLPYMPFAVSGVMLLALSFWKKRDLKTLLTLSAAVLTWVAFGFLLQERTTTFYVLISVVGMLGFLRGWRLSYKIVIAGLFVYLWFMVYGQMRWVIPVVMEGRMSSQAAVEWVQENSAADWIMPENNEFAGPFYSLVYNVDDPAPLRWGKSYVDGFLYFLPKVLYPSKPVPIGNEFAQEVHSKFATAYSPVSGWGYSPVAEALVNFGWAGVAILPVFWAVGLDLLERFRWRNTFALLCVTSLLGELQNANRINWTWVWTESVFNIVVCALAILFVRLVANSMQSNRAPAKPSFTRAARGGSSE